MKTAHHYLTWKSPLKFFFDCDFKIALNRFYACYSTTSNLASAFFQPFQSEQNIENPYLRVFKDGVAKKADGLAES